jgi:1-acyl-sn-glycerol-3-phosphate acyltransferase
MIVSPGLQIAMKPNKLAIAPEGTRISAYFASNTSAHSAAAIPSISSIASSPISYLSPGYPSDGRDPMPEASSASAFGFITLVAGLRLKHSCS